MPDVNYYLASDTRFAQSIIDNWQEGGFSALIGASTTALSDAITNGLPAVGAANVVAKFVVKVGNEYLIQEVIIKNSENLGLVAENPETGQEFLIGFTEYATDALIVNGIVAAAVGTSLFAGASLVTIAFGASLVWSGTKEIGEEAYQTFTDTTDNSVKLFNSQGKEIGGAFWEHNPNTTPREAVEDLLNEMVTRYDQNITDGMYVTFSAEHFWGIYEELIGTYYVSDGEILQSLANAFFDGDAEDFLSFEENDSLYANTAQVFFGRAEDTISVPTDGGTRNFLITDIFTANDSFVSGTSNQDILIGSTSSERLVGGAGADLLLGLNGNDEFFGHASSSNIDGDIFYGGSTSSRGTSDGSDTVFYSTLSIGVDLTLENSQGDMTASLTGANNNEPKDQLFSIENVILTSRADRVIVDDLPSGDITIDGNGDKSDSYLFKDVIDLSNYSESNYELSYSNSFDQIIIDESNVKFKNFDNVTLSNGSTTIDRDGDLGVTINGGGGNNAVVDYRSIDLGGNGILVQQYSGGRYIVWEWDGEKVVNRSNYDVLYNVERIIGTNNDDIFLSSGMVYSGEGGDDIYSSYLSPSEIDEDAGEGFDTIYAYMYYPENTTGIDNGSTVDVFKGSSLITFTKVNSLEGITPYQNNQYAIEDYIDDVSDELPPEQPNGNPNDRPIGDNPNDGLDDFNDAKDFVFIPGDGSPLVLDVNGNGIELAALGSSGSVYWDIDEDGYREASGWITGGDALLAHDLNQDGFINDHSELFGSLSTDGFTVLADYDSNGDNLITAADTDFNNLLLWIDANANGYSEDTELYTLSDFNITEINLSASLVDYDIAGNNISHESTFTMNGQTQTIVDAWFAYDNMNSQYQYNIKDLHLLNLPDVRGYGDVKDLSIALSLDATLKTMVEDVVFENPDTLLDSAYDLTGKVADIMFKWAGVENVDPESRGWFDARKLTFLEKYFGEEFEHVQYGNPNVGPYNPQIQDLESSFNKIAAEVTNAILLKTQIPFFSENASYDAYTGTFSNTVPYVFKFIDANSDVYTVGAENDTHEAFVVDSSVINLTISNSGGEDTIWWRGAHSEDVTFERSNSDLIIHNGTKKITIENQFHDQTYRQIENIVFENGVTVDLTSNLTFEGSEWGETITGSDGDDTLLGLGGNDTIYANEGNDTIIGGAGDDMLVSYGGDDTYEWSIGDGNDTIFDSRSNSDIIIFHDVNLEDIGFSRSNRNLLINIGKETITIDDQYFASIYTTSTDKHRYEIETLVFENGDTFDLSAVLENEAVKTVDDGFHVYTNGTITGNLLLNDSDVEGDSFSAVAGSFYTEHGLIDIQQDGSFTYSPDVDYTGKDSFIYFVEDARGVRSSSDVVFTLIDNTLGNLITIGSENGEVLNGDQNGIEDNIFYGLGGNDTIKGFDGSDILIGGNASDTLQGGVGDDTYEWSIGDGNDYIYEEGGNDTLKLHDVSENDIRFTKTITSYGALEIHIDNEKITISDHFKADVTGEISDLSSQIENIVLDDGTTIDLTGGLTFTGSDINEHIYGTYQYNDILQGQGNDDTLKGFDGNDTLIGGVGSDTLHGGIGNDTYEWSIGDGNDYIYEEGGNDTLKLHGVTESDLRLEKDLSGNFGHLKIHIGNDTIRVGDNFRADTSGDASDITTRLESIVLDDGTTIDLTGGLTFTGSNVNEHIYGTYQYSDTLFGGAGDDTLKGFGGNDILIGSTGSDSLYGGSGDDIYEWSVGDGNDYISEEGGNDTLKLHGITESDIKIKKDLSGNFGHLEIKIGNETIHVNDNFRADTSGDASYITTRLESILLDDGTTIDLTGGLTFTGTEVADGLFGTYQYNDVLIGEEGNDIIQGLGGADILIGGVGNDTLTGGTGDDTYEWSVGDENDFIFEEGGNDTLELHGVTASDIRIIKTYNSDLKVHIGDETIQIQNHFDADTSGDFSNITAQLESIMLDDGTTIDLTGGLTFTGSNAENENIYGTYQFNDALYGMEGHDTLHGYGGNDILIGGEGSDDLYGGDGDDVYEWSVGDGDDNIIETGGTDKLNLHGSFASDVSYTRFSNNLKIEINTETITVLGFFNNENTKLEDVVFDDGTIVNLPELLNEAPIAYDDDVILDQDQTIIGNVLVSNGHGADTDHDGNALTVLAGTYTTTNGSIIIAENGDFTYTPNAGYNGSDSYIYTIQDEYGVTDTATINVTVRPPNIAPNAQNDDFVGDQDIDVTGNVLSDNGNGADTDPDSDPITVVAGTFATTNGSVTISSNGSFTYAPNTGYVGTDSFTYTLQDDRGGSDVGTVNITVNELINNPNAINGTSANETLNGDPDGISNDTLIGNGGNDTLNGKLGNDSYEWSVGDGNDTINETGGTDQLVLHGVTENDLRFEKSGSYNLKIHVDSETITLNYQAYSDYQNNSAYDSYQIESLLLDDGTTIDLTEYLTFTGTAGNDTINGLLQSDNTFVGKEGNDTLNGTNNNDSYEWSVGDGNDTINETGGTDQLVLHGVTENDLRFEKSGSYNLKIHVDSETITLNYQAYSDYQNNSAYDFYQIESLLLDDGTIIDLTSPLLENDTFIATSGAEIHDGGIGTDTVDYSNSDAGIIVDLLNNTASGGYAAGDTFISIENLIGSDFDDIITGTSDDNILQGGLGDDEYHYISGNDIIVETGGADDALYLDIPSPSEADPDRVKLVRYMTNADDLQIRIDLSAASDESDIGTILVENYFDESSDAGRIEHIVFNGAVDMSFDRFEIITFANGIPMDIDGVSVGNHQQDVIYGTLATENINAGDGVDFVYGNGGGDTIHGGNDGDALYGWNGIDVIYGDAGDDYIFGDDNATNTANTGADILSGGAGSDWLEGEKGNDTIYGGTESDYLLGGEGDDLLYGNGGDDHLFGGAGADTFIWLAGDIGTVDTVYDFNAAEGDKLDISDLLSGYDAANDAITDFVQISESGTNSFINIDVDGGADNFVNIAFLYNVTGLTDEEVLETSGILIAA